jgi:hypothetical protein
VVVNGLNWIFNGSGHNERAFVKGNKYKHSGILSFSLNVNSGMICHHAGKFIRLEYPDADASFSSSLLVLCPNKKTGARCQGKDGYMTASH